MKGAGPERQRESLLYEFICMKLWQVQVTQRDRKADGGSPGRRWGGAARAQGPSELLGVTDVLTLWTAGMDSGARYINVTGPIKLYASSVCTKSTKPFTNCLHSCAFAYRLDLLPVQPPSVQQDGVDRVARSRGLNLGRHDVQQVLKW